MIITSLVVPKGFYHYVAHIPDLVKHLAHHHDHGDHHEHDSPAPDADNQEDHHNHSDLPFNHDHSSDGNTLQAITLFHYQPEIAFNVSVGDNRTLTRPHSLFNSEFIQKIWLPPKVC